MTQPPPGYTERSASGPPPGFPPPGYQGPQQPPTGPHQAPQGNQQTPRPHLMLSDISTPRLLAIAVAGLGLLNVIWGFLESSMLTSTGGREIPLGNMFHVAGWVPALLLLSGLAAASTFVPAVSKPTAWAVSAAAAVTGGVGALFYLLGRAGIDGGLGYLVNNNNGLGTYEDSASIGLILSVIFGLLQLVVTMAGLSLALAPQSKARRERAPRPPRPSRAAQQPSGPGYGYPGPQPSAPSGGPQQYQDPRYSQAPPAGQPPEYTEPQQYQDPRYAPTGSAGPQYGDLQQFAGPQQQADPQQQQADPHQQYADPQQYGPPQQAPQYAPQQYAPEHYAAPQYQPGQYQPEQYQPGPQQFAPSSPTESEPQQYSPSGYQQPGHPSQYTEQPVYDPQSGRDVHTGIPTGPTPPGPGPVAPPADRATPTPPPPTSFAAPPVQYARTEYGSPEFAWEPTYSEAPDYEKKAAEVESEEPPTDSPAQRTFVYETPERPVYEPPRLDSGRHQGWDAGFVKETAAENTESENPSQADGPYRSIPRAE